MSRNKPIFTLLAFLATVPLLFAQKPADIKRNGEKAYENGRWAAAKSLLTQYQELKPGELDVLTKLGITHFQLGQGAEARRFLEYVAAKSVDSRDPDLYYYLARTLHGLGDWEKAIAAYKKFMRVCGEKHRFRANAADNIRRCVMGMRMAENPDIALIENLGERVNSAGDEFAPLPSVNFAERLYFAAAREGCIGGLRNTDGYEDTERGHWSSDMFAAKLSNSGWEAAGSLGGLLNSSRFEVPLGFNGNGQVLYFFRGFSTYSGEILADTAAKKDEYALAPPSFISPVQPAAGDVDAYFFDEKTIIFSSRRAGGTGGLDLWYTQFADTAWTAPVNFGPTINSPYDETSPFLARDGRSLFFSSNRVESMGGLDVYRAVFDDKKIAWQEPVNLGSPINSAGDDAYFRLTKDGQSAFFSSDRLGGFGARDLYIAYYKDPVSAQLSKSQPEFFALVGKNDVLLPVEQETVVFPALLYENERDILIADNLKTLDYMAAVARQHPETNLLVTVFTDDSGQSKFDLYHGIKRAETVGKALTDRGVPAGRITLRSVGAAFPLARILLNGTDNPEGRRLNKRIEVGLSSIDPLRFNFALERPTVSALMSTESLNTFDQQNTGLSFRVEAAVTRQILTNDAIAMFGDMMIESQPGAGAYRYLVGHFSQFDKAAKLAKELSGLGFEDARINAYINGIRISKAEAVGLVKKYPDIVAFIKG